MLGKAIDECAHFSLELTFLIFLISTSLFRLTLRGLFDECPAVRETMARVVMLMPSPLKSHAYPLCSSNAAQHLLLSNKGQLSWFTDFCDCQLDQLTERAESEEQLRAA